MFLAPQSHASTSSLRIGSTGKQSPDIAKDTEHYRQRPAGSEAEIAKGDSHSSISSIRKVPLSDLESDQQALSSVTANPSSPPLFSTPKPVANPPDSDSTKEKFSTGENGSTSMTRTPVLPDFSLQASQLSQAPELPPVVLRAVAHAEKRAAEAPAPPAKKPKQSVLSSIRKQPSKPVKLSYSLKPLMNEVSPVKCWCLHCIRTTEVL